MAFYFAHMAMADLVCCVLAAAPQSSTGSEGDQAMKQSHGRQNLINSNSTGAAIPRTVDWRKKGAVTNVKQQRECACSWAFSAVATVEGIHQIKTGKLVSLSAQHLLDCTSDILPSAAWANSCEGGEVAYAFDYIIHNGGIASEVAYPYRYKKEKCKHPTPPAAMIKSYQHVPPSEEALLAAVAKQPIAVAIAAFSKSFGKYRGGVMKASSCGTDTDSWVTTVVGSRGGRHGGGIKTSVGACGIGTEASYFPVA